MREYPNQSVSRPLWIDDQVVCEHSKWSPTPVSKALVARGLLKVSLIKAH
jgi:hypothetical protein